MRSISTPAIVGACIFLSSGSKAAYLNRTSNILSRENYIHRDSTGKDTAYEFTGRLVDAIPLQPKCGNLYFAVIQKFDVLETNYPMYKEKFVLIIQPCPEQGSKNFFRANSIYKMLVTKNPSHYGFVIQNLYSKTIYQNFGAGKPPDLSKNDLDLRLSYAPRRVYHLQYNYFNNCNLCQTMEKIQLFLISGE
jgi:hypothetical protein